MSATETDAVHWDPYNQKYYPDPYPTLRRLREEAPIYYNEEYDFYAVSHYEDVKTVFGDRDTFSSARGDVLEHIKSNIPIPKGMFIAEDPPLHTIHRSTVTRVFTPKNMQALEPQIRAYCAQALDPLVEGGEFDFIEDLGSEMPMRVIGMLLGIPEEDLKTVQQRVDASLYAEPGKPMDTEHGDLTGSFYEDYINWRIKNPSDDLMTQLLRTEFEDETGVRRTLTPQEVMVYVNILAGAGNETTNRLIGWLGKVFAEHPDQRRQVYENRALIPQAVEEVLRFEPPGPVTARYVARGTEFYGVKVPKGSAMLAIVASANRDDRLFVDGDTFNILRERQPHMTFGYGFHNCLGNALARVEGRIALDELLNRFPEWNVELDKAKLSPSTTTRGWHNLPAYTPTAKRGSRKPKATAQTTLIPEGAEQWKLTMKTPAGPQDLTARLVRADDGSLSGVVETAMGAQPIKGGKATGDSLSWAMDVTNPMPVTLQFDVTQSGDAMRGEVKFGIFGAGEVAGARVRA